MKNFKRLMKLPALITADDLLELGVTRENTRSTLLRCQQEGLLRRAGPRSGFYFNLLRAKPDVTQAIKAAIPSAIRIGANLLSIHNITSQISQVEQIAWLKTREHRSVVQLYGVESSGRSRGWYEAIAGHTHEGPSGLLELDLPWALADMWLSGAEDGEFTLDDDDLELTDSDVEAQDVEDALIALGAAPDWAQARTSLGFARSDARFLRGPDLQKAMKEIEAMQTRLQSLSAYPAHDQTGVSADKIEDAPSP